MRLHQVTTLPATLEADAMYLVLNGDYCESFVTDNAGVAKFVGNSTMIDERVSLATSALSGFEFVADVAARDALSPTVNQLILVTDASGDANVDSGAAMYAYSVANDEWTKVTEFESFNENVILDWSAIQNGPTSSVADIDAAVSARHAHTNKTQLDFIGGTATAPTYNDLPISLLATNNW